jgi:CRISPR-associated protein Csb2
MMADYLCLSIEILDGRFHGKGDEAIPEWPPSPLRAFQALVAAGAARWPTDFEQTATKAFEWLQSLPAPEILSPSADTADHAYRLYVPNNAGDLVTRAWAAGNNAASIASHRTEKDCRPTWIRSCDSLAGSSPLRFLWTLAEPKSKNAVEHITTLRDAARGVSHFGWGSDLAYAQIHLVDESERSGCLAEPGIDHWLPGSAGTPLRLPRSAANGSSGTLAALKRRHQAFLGRMRGGRPQDVVPLTASAFGETLYRRSSDRVPPRWAMFELRRDDESFLAYPQQQLIHVAGMVRHLAIESMLQSPPDDVAPDWVETFVAGHAKGSPAHRQVSYLPLPSIGHAHTDPRVRRVMIAAPARDGDLLDYLANCIAGRPLVPTDRTRLVGPVHLTQVRGDRFSALYVAPARAWATVTPVILPGYDDRQVAKTSKLIMRALRHAGITSPCTFRWSPTSVFAKSLSAYNRGRNGRLVGYVRPSHLLHQTAIHLQLDFGDRQVSGPLAIGVGRHCGLGILAPIRNGRDA